jgi:hypothetical protein
MHKTELISSYYSDDKSRTAYVRQRVATEYKYVVTSSDGEGNINTNAFHKLEHAEDFAEDFVIL